MPSREEQHELGVQGSAESCQMSLIPAKASGFKLSSWVFDGGIEKDCLHAVGMRQGGRHWRLLLVDL